MSNERKRIRHQEVLELRAAGRAAAFAGKSVQSCREQYCNKMQWEQGFYDAQREMVEEARQIAERQRREYALRKEQAEQQKLEDMIRRIVREELAKQ